MNRNALDALEEAITLLRKLPPQGWMQYALGAVPFLLVAVAFFEDMGSGYSGNRCLLEAFGCALAFLWLSFWKARFAGTLLRSMSENDSAAGSSVWACSYAQTVLQGLKLLILPLAAVSILPFAWTSALFRNINVEADLANVTVRSAVGNAAQRASLGQRNLWIGLALLGSVAVVTFVNILLFLLFAPFLTKIVTGYENQWTLNAGHLVNTRVLLITVALTWLALDPVYQAFAVVRCFYFEARKDGRDLLVQLRRFGAAALLLLAVVCCAPVPVDAAQASISNQELDRDFTQVLQGDEYAWHRKSGLTPDDGSLLSRLARDIDNAGKKINSAMAGFESWIRGLFKDSQQQPAPGKNGAGPRIQWILYSIGGVLAIGIVLATVRRKTRSGPTAIPAAAADLRQHDVGGDVSPAELPDEEWLRLARDFSERGELRLAIRAMYLSNLSYLGARHMLTIARSKTNGMYERELRLRARVPSLCTEFATANRVYEGAWYGLHEVTPDVMDVFENSVQVIRQHAGA